MRYLRVSVLLALLGFASPAHAATTLFVDGPVRVRPGADVVYAIRARIDSAVNAVGYSVAYDPAAVASVEFVPGDAVVRQWLNRSADAGRVRAEGIIPGGTAPVLNDTVPVGYVRLRFARTGTTTLALTDTEVYLHQPVPVRDTVTTAPLRVTVADDAPAITAASPASPEETFVRIVRDPGLFEGRWALIFDIRDAGGPVAHALIRERFLGLFGTWRELSSPASLSDQLRMSILEVGMSDGSGVHILYRETPTRLTVLAAVLGLSAVAYAVRRRMKR